MKRVYRLVMTLFVFGFLTSCTEKGKMQVDRVEPAEGITAGGDKIHIIGGGSQNKFLCQLTANATGLQVIAGPAEGTAIGNLLVQAMGLGYVSSLSEIREIVRNSCETVVFQPVDTDKWDGVWDRFVKIVTSDK